MLYVFRSVPSQGARDLAEALSVNARKISSLQQPHYGQGLRSGDIVVAWGEAVNPVTGVRILNGAPMLSKFDAAERLRQAGVATIEVSRTRPTARQLPPPVDPALAARQAAHESAGEYAGIDLQNLRNPAHIQAVNEIIAQFTTLRTALSQPAPVAPPPQAVGEWLARANNHVGGNDLLRPTTNPSYYAKKETLTEEIRIHSFLGKSIRAGKKVIRDGFVAPGGAITGGQQAHPWIRSYEGGWRIQYDGYSSKRAQRELAHAAVRALGLDFGAVDLGKKADGTWIVLEVNRAPGQEGNTIETYARSIESWIRGEWTADNDAATQRRAA